MGRFHTPPSREWHRFGVVLCIAIAAGSMSSAEAVPRRIILGRHGEKANAYALCTRGQQRSLALRDQFLGRSARSQALLEGQQPVAFLAITPHTLETLAPSARSWSLPVVMFSQVPQQGESTATKRQLQQQRTREAAAQVLSNPTWAGGTVVMAWEHRTIANQQLAERFPDQPVTLRQLLNLDQLQGVPDTWPDDTYGWIWIIDYDNAPSPIPTGFRMVREAFAAPYSHLKAPAWGRPVPQADGCLP
jgi:hypothetical protein